MNEFTRTVTSYCGADTIIMVGDEIIGECQELRMREDFRSENGLIEGVIECIVFDRDNKIDELARRDETFSIFIKQHTEFADQPGALREIKDVKFTVKEMGLTVDQLVEIEKYYFTASKIVRTVLPSHDEVMAAREEV